MSDHKYKPCPACPDGSVWTRDGTTGATCPVCKGHAALNLDGSPLVKCKVCGYFECECEDESDEQS